MIRQPSCQFLSEKIYMHVEERGAGGARWVYNPLVWVLGGEGGVPSMTRSCECYGVYAGVTWPIFSVLLVENASTFCICMRCSNVQKCDKMHHTHIPFDTYTTLTHMYACIHTSRHVHRANTSWFCNCHACTWLARMIIIRLFCKRAL